MPQQVAYYAGRQDSQAPGTTTQRAMGRVEVLKSRVAMSVWSARLAATGNGTRRYSRLSRCADIRAHMPVRSAPTSPRPKPRHPEPAVARGVNATRGRNALH